MVGFGRDLKESITLRRPYFGIRAEIEKQANHLLLAARHGVGKRSVPGGGVIGEETVVTEATFERARVFGGDIADALRQSILNRFDHVHRAGEDEVPGGDLTGVVSPARRRAAILLLAGADVGAVAHERGDRAEVAVPGGGVQGSVAGS